MLVASWFSTVGFAETLKVGPTQAFATVKDAVVAALPFDRIEVDPGVYQGPLWLGIVPIEIVSTGGPDVTTLVPTEGEFSVIGVNAPELVTIRGFTIDGLSQTGPIWLSGATFHGSELRILGGTDASIGAYDSSVVITDSSFVGQPDRCYRHIFQQFGSLELDGVTFAKGCSVYAGAAVYSNGAVLSVRNSVFTDNTSDYGGAISAEGTADVWMVIESSRFERNEAVRWGGAVAVHGGVASVIGNTFLDNRALGGASGGLHSYASQITISDNRFERNEAVSGGAVGLFDTETVTVLRNVFVDNTALLDGGGAVQVISPIGPVAVEGNWFCGSTAADYGGGLDIYNAGSVTTQNNGFVDNHATIGAAVSATASNVTVAQATVLDSIAEPAGGALYFGYGTTAVLTNTAVVGSVGTAIVLDGAIGFGAEYPLLWANDNDWIGNAGPSTEVAGDPRFVDPIPAGCAADVHPAAGSALIDAGDPAWVDDDGTRSDIGVYGGPGASTRVDVDGDGIVLDDCAPYDAAAGGLLPEVAGDGLDQGCDGLELCYVDADEDGVGGASTVTGAAGCAVPGVAGQTGDCDDADPDDRCAERERAPLPDAWFCATGGGPGVAGWAPIVWLLWVRRQRPSS